MRLEFVILLRLCYNANIYRGGSDKNSGGVKANMRQQKQLSAKTLWGGGIICLYLTYRNSNPSC